MARVVPAQLKHIQFKSDSRYSPVKQENVGGIIMLIDKKPEEEEDLLQPRVPEGGKREKNNKYVCVCIYL